MRSSICSNYILKAQQNNNDNNVHEEKRTKDTEGPTFFLNQLFLAASRFWVSWCNIHEILIWKFLNVYYLNHIDLKLSEYTLFKIILPFDPLISLLIYHWNQKPQQQSIEPFHAAQRQGKHKLKVTGKEQPSFPMKQKVLTCNITFTWQHNTKSKDSSHYRIIGWI